MSQKSDEGVPFSGALAPKVVLARFLVSFLLLSVLWLVIYRLFAAPALHGTFLEPIAGLVRDALYLVMSALIALVVLRRPLRTVTREREAAREFSERLQEALGAAGDGIWVNNFMFSRDYNSDEVFKMLGFEPMDPYDAFWLFQTRVHPDDRKLWEAANAEIQKPGNNHFEVKVRVLHRKGEWCRIWVRGRCVERTDHGAPARMVGTYTNITEQSRHEEWLAGALSALRMAFHAVPLPIAVISKNWKVAIASDRWEGFLTAFALTSVLDDPPAETREPTAVPENVIAGNCSEIRAAVQSVLDGSAEEDKVVVQRDTAGKDIRAEIMVGAIKSNGRILGAVLTCRDATLQHRCDKEEGSQVAISESGSEVSPLSVTTADNIDSRASMLNPSDVSESECAEYEILSEDSSLTSGLYQELFWKACERAAAGENVGRIRVQCRRPDGTRVQAALWITPAESASGENGKDPYTSERGDAARADAGQEATSRELELILAHVPLAVLYLNPESHTIISSSSSVATVFGYSAEYLTGKPLKILYKGKRDYAASKAAFSAAQEAQVVTRGVHQMRDKDGHTFNGKVTVVPGVGSGETASAVMLIFQEMLGTG